MGPPPPGAPSNIQKPLQIPKFTFGQAFLESEKSPQEPKIPISGQVLPPPPGTPFQTPPVEQPFGPPLPGDFSNTQNPLQFPSFTSGGTDLSQKDTKRGAKRHKNPVEFPPPPGPKMGFSTKTQEHPKGTSENDSTWDLDQKCAETPPETPQNAMDTPPFLGKKMGISPMSQEGLTGTFGVDSSSNLVQNQGISAPKMDPLPNIWPITQAQKKALEYLVGSEQKDANWDQKGSEIDDNASEISSENMGSPMALDEVKSEQKVPRRARFEGALVPSSHGRPDPVPGAAPAMKRSYGAEILPPIGSILGGSLSPLPQMPNFECLAQISVRRTQSGSGRGHPGGALPDPHGSGLSHGKQRLLAGSLSAPKAGILMGSEQKMLSETPVVMGSQILMAFSPGIGESPHEPGEKRHMTPTSHDSGVSVGGKWQKTGDAPPSPSGWWPPWDNHLGTPVHWCKMLVQ